MSKILSISIAAYNVGQYIDKTINSLLGTKSFEKLEIIIVNDGSTDDTLEISKKYRNLYKDSIVLVDKPNGGYGSTINHSIEIASGKYFKQLDGDDWFQTENIDNFVEFLENTDADLVLSPFSIYYETTGNETIVNAHKMVTGSTTKVSEIAFSENIAMHELTIKTDLLKTNNIRITENCFYTDNEYTFLPFIKSETICKFDKPIYVYRIGREGQSVSITGAKKHYKDTMKVANRLICAYEDSKKINNPEVIWKKIKYVIDSVYTYYLVSDDENARKELYKYDKELKQSHPEIYKETYSIKKVLILRMTNFVAYPFVQKKVVRAWE